MRWWRQTSAQLRRTPRSYGLTTSSHTARTFSLVVWLSVTRYVWYAHLVEEKRVLVVGARAQASY